MRTLYISDLDGTLLRSDQRLSPFTIDTLNSLISRGMLFSYATARSYVTSSKVTRGITPPIPVITYNGAWMLENGTARVLNRHCFTAEESREVFDTLTAQGVWPIVYAMVDGVERFSYCPERCTPGMRDFNATRRGDPRERSTSEERLADGEAFYFTCIDQPEKLMPLYERYKDTFQCVYSRDIYGGEQWLELMPRKATKANAMLELKQMLGCDRVVCFGDAENDLSLFAAADEGYAVANAVDALKEAATAVIGNNDEDGVARWLLENAQ